MVLTALTNIFKGTSCGCNANKRYTRKQKQKRSTRKRINKKSRKNYRGGYQHSKSVHKHRSMSSKRFKI